MAAVTWSTLASERHRRRCAGILQFDTQRLARDGWTNYHPDRRVIEIRDDLANVVRNGPR
jgi:hypothetical protein